MYLSEEVVEDLVIGQDWMRSHTQQKVLQAYSAALNKVGVHVVCRQLVPHKLCLNAREQTKLHQSYESYGSFEFNYHTLSSSHSHIRIL